MNMEKNKLFGLILAGGHSKRMGQDKALLSYHGKPQVEHVRDLLEGVCAKVFISAKGRGTVYTVPLIACPLLVDDPQFADAGPLTGILSAMTAHPDVSWLVMACDLPFVTAETLQYLLKNRDITRPATAFISTNDGLPEPLCAVWEHHGSKAFLEFFKKGLHCPRKILIKSNARLIAQKDPHWLDNVNTPEEYQQVLAIIRG